MRNSYCTGHVVHHRRFPKNHRFKYGMSWCLFDLSEISSTLSASRWFSMDRFNVISLRSTDYINDEPISIEQKVRDYLQSQTHKKVAGKVFLFTHPRFLGMGFNSVNFYLNFSHCGQLQYIVSEINNTPWGEKHLYFHDLTLENQSAERATFAFSKAFHISPFAQMDIDYVWTFMLKDEQFNVNMALKQDDKDVLNVSMKTTLKPMTTSNQRKWLLSRPFQGMKMLSGIYWQALKIWFKGIPFFSHPASQKTH